VEQGARVPVRRVDVVDREGTSVRQRTELDDAGGASAGGNLPLRHPAADAPAASRAANLRTPSRLVERLVCRPVEGSHPVEQRDRRSALSRGSAGHDSRTSARRLAAAAADGSRCAAACRRSGASRGGLRAAPGARFRRSDGWRESLRAVPPGRGHGRSARLRLHRSRSGSGAGCGDGTEREGCFQLAFPVCIRVERRCHWRPGLRAHRQVSAPSGERSASGRVVDLGNRRARINGCGRDPRERTEHGAVAERAFDPGRCDCRAPGAKSCRNAAGGRDPAVQDRGGRLRPPRQFRRAQRHVETRVRAAARARPAGSRRDRAAADPGAGADAGCAVAAGANRARERQPGARARRAGERGGDGDRTHRIAAASRRSAVTAHAVAPRRRCVGGGRSGRA
jgi:hypothetical protein